MERRSHRGSCKLWRTNASGQRQKRQVAPSHVDSNMLEQVVAGAQSSSAAAVSIQSGERERELSSIGLGNVAPMELAHPSEPTPKSHAPVQEHDESLVPQKHLDEDTATHCWPSAWITRVYGLGALGCDGRSYRQLEMRADTSFTGFSVHQLAQETCWVMWTRSEETHADEKTCHRFLRQLKHRWQWIPRQKRMR